MPQYFCFTFPIIHPFQPLTLSPSLTNSHLFKGNGPTPIPCCQKAKNKTHFGPGDPTSKYCDPQRKAGHLRYVFL